MLSLDSNMQPEFQSGLYSDIKKEIRPLDLILFRGGEFVSTAIRYLENLEVGNGDWSHVGLVVTKDVLPNLKNAKEGQLYVWESTLSGKLNDDVMDLESGKSVFGVQVRSLDKLVPEYNKGEALVAWSALENNPYVQRKGESDEAYKARKAKLVDTLSKLHKEYYHEEYELNPITLLAALYPCLRKLRDKLGSGKGMIFCSELVATIYCDIGVLDAKEVDPENVLPVDLLGDADKEFKPVNRQPVLLKLELDETSTSRE